MLFDSTTHYPDAPAEPVSLQALLAEEAAAREVAARNEHLRKEAAAATTELGRAQAAVQAARDALERAEDDLLAVEVRVQETGRAAANLTDPDLTEIRQRLGSVETVNAQVEQNRRRALMAEGIEDTKARAEQLSREIGEIDVEKARALAEAHFPVEGLSFDGDQVTFRGLPLEQASDSERLRIAVAMGIAMNPELKVLLIRDGSLLDEDSLAMVGAMAEEAGAQVWLEIVGKDGVGVIIEDGAVAEVVSPAECAS